MYITVLFIKLLYFGTINIRVYLQKSIMYKSRRLPVRYSRYNTPQREPPKWTIKSLLAFNVSQATQHINERAWNRRFTSEPNSQKPHSCLGGPKIEMRAFVYIFWAYPHTNRVITHVGPGPAVRALTTRVTGRPINISIIQNSK